MFTKYLLEKGTLNFFLQTPGLSVRAGGRGFSLATMSVAPGYFYWKIEENRTKQHS